MGVQILPESQLSDEISIQEKEVWWNKKYIRLYKKNVHTRVSNSLKRDFWQLGSNRKQYFFIHNA